VSEPKCKSKDATLLISDGDIVQVAVSDDTAQTLAFKALEKLKRIQQVLACRN
jgi:hypothetical protein